MERVKGIEPSSQAWEARILPLNHTRSRCKGLFSRDRSGLQPVRFADFGVCIGSAGSAYDTLASSHFLPTCANSSENQRFRPARCVVRLRVFAGNPKGW